METSHIPVTMAFPTMRPSETNFIRPRQGEALDITPPGFCWWRAAERGACQYRLTVKRGGAVIYTSPLTPDPLHVPDTVFAPGPYAWYVEAVAKDGSVGARSKVRQFSINEKAPEQPWVDPRVLLDRVPAAHPRLFFPASQLEAVRETLSTTRAEAFAALKQKADAGLSVAPIPEPDYDRIADPAERRLAYFDSFHETRRVHDDAMRAMALVYVLTDERRYGEHAKTLILDAASWDPEGISSILAPYGDEVGLGLVRVGAEVYDWLFDLFSEDERQRVAAMVRARADQMLRRLEKKDYTYQPGESHDGRLPGFLLEHAIALAEDPRAAAWAEYALNIIATNFPHWAGKDGGWAQGVSYGLAYNVRDVIPLHAWQVATGHNLWLKPFYQKLPWFFAYVVSPRGEIMPFGDQEHLPVKAHQARTLMMYHGLRLQNPRLRQWAEQVQAQQAHEPRIEPFSGILMADDGEPEAVEPLANDRVFRGVGWGALHSDIADPQTDLMVLLRSSPYGGVSHGHASQNDVAVLKGGTALLCAGGERFPHHGSPFHTQYAQLSQSHNCILVDGHGAINRDGHRGGRIVDFFSSETFGYASGEAEQAYGARLERWRRHLILIRPAVLLVVDDLIAPAPATFQWLLHARQAFDLDHDAQVITTRRQGVTLKGQLYASIDFAMRQTDDWPIAPDAGYPTLTRPLPEKRWHFTAETAPTDELRIACVFAIHGPGESAPDLHTTVTGQQIALHYGAKVNGHIDLAPDRDTIVQIQCGAERLRICS